VGNASDVREETLLFGCLGFPNYADAWKKKSFFLRHGDSDSEEFRRKRWMKPTDLCRDVKRSKRLSQIGTKASHRGAIQRRKFQNKKDFNFNKVIGDPHRYLQ